MDAKIQYYKEMYMSIDKPIPFKSLLLYPVKVKDYLTFSYSCGCLDIDKNSIPDIRIIQMKYFEFLMHLYENGDLLTLYKLKNILELVFQVSYDDGEIEIYKQENGKYILRIKDETIDSEEFNLIRKLILYQNIAGYKDMEHIDPSLKKDQERYSKIINKGIVMPNLEDKIDVVIVSTSLDMDRIEKLSIRRFTRIFNKCVEKQDYIINKTASMSGMVTFKEPIEHWVFKNEKSDIQGLVSMETMKQKLQN